MFQVWVNLTKVYFLKVEEKISITANIFTSQYSLANNNSLHAHFHLAQITKKRSNSRVSRATNEGQRLSLLTISRIL